MDHLQKKIAKCINEKIGYKKQNADQFNQLTGREKEILQLLAEGYNNPLIAGKLRISRSTVETHRKHLKKKLNSRSYSKLVKYALAFDLTDF